MGSGVNPIVFQVSDGVDPAIASNVAAISTAAKQADASVQVLTQSLQNVSNSGLVGLAKQISDASSSTTRLSNTTAKMGVAALTTSTNVDKLANSYNNLGKTILGLTASLATYSASVSTANSASNSFQAAQANAGAGVGRVTSNTIAASAAIRELEGNFNGGGRAAGRFLAVTLGLGPALSAAFPVIGALALVGVLGTVVSAVDKLIERIKSVSIEAQIEALNILNSNKRLIKGESGVGTTVFNEGLGRQNLPNQIIDDPQKFIAEINYRTQIKEIQEKGLEAGKTGLELDKAKQQTYAAQVKDLQDALKLIVSARETLANIPADSPLAKSLQELKDPSIQKLLDVQSIGLLNKTVNVNADKYSPSGLPAAPNFQPLVPVDSKPFNEVTAATKEYDSEVDRLIKQIGTLKAESANVQLKEPFDAAKEAAKQARLQLKQFADEMAKLKQDDKLVTPQDKLALLKDQQRRALPLNKTALDAQIGTETQAIERQIQAYANANEKLQEQANNIGLYSNALKEANEFDKISLELKKNGVQLTLSQSLALKDLIHQTVSQAQYQTELKKIYEEFNAPAETLQAALNAIYKLQKDGVITANDAAIAQNQVTRAFDDSVNPLNAYTRGLQSEITLFGIYGTKATVAAEVLKVQNDLMSKGRSLTDAQAASLTQFLKGLELQKELQKDVNALYNQNKGAVDKLVVSTLALVTARNKGIISDKQYDVGLAKIAIDMADLAIQMGKFTKSDVLTSTFGNFIKDFNGLSAGIIKTWQNAFNTIADGAANSLGRAIAYGEDLGKALQDVARQALSELISGFIKLGIQQLITVLIGKTAGQTAVAASIAQAAAVGAAWAAPAAFVSLSSFGANAGPADLALGSTVAFAQALNALKFNSGGVVPGYGNRDSVAAMLTPGEGVLNQRAMRYLGVDTLNALNRGQTIQSKVGSSAGFGSPVIMFNLIHDKNAVNVQQINENTIRIVAKDEASKAVQTQAGPVVAAHIGDPNSRVSKSIGTHLDAPRKR